MPLKDFHECPSFPKHVVSGFQSLPPSFSQPQVLEAVHRGLMGGERSQSQGRPHLALHGIEDGAIADEGELRYLLSPL